MVQECRDSDLPERSESLRQHWRLYVCMANTEETMRGRCSKEGRPPGGPCIRRHGNPSGTERREPRARQLATSAPIKLLVCTSHDPALTIVTRAIVWYLMVATAGGGGREEKTPVSQTKEKETETEMQMGASG